MLPTPLENTAEMLPCLQRMQKLWSPGAESSTGPDRGLYLLQEDRELKAELFLKLWIPSKEGDIYHDLARDSTRR